MYMYITQNIMHISKSPYRLLQFLLIFSESCILVRLKHCSFCVKTADNKLFKLKTFRKHISQKNGRYATYKKHALILYILRK